MSDIGPPAGESLSTPPPTAPRPGIEISRRILLINSVSSGLRRVLSMSVLVWVYQHLIRCISAEEYAIYPVLMAVMEFFPLATTLFMSGLRRYTTTAYAQGDERRTTQYVSTMFPLLCGLAVVVLIGGWLLAWNISSVLTIAPSQVDDARLMFTLLTLSAALDIGAAPLSMGFHLRQKFLAMNLIGLGREIMRIVLLLVLLSVSTRVLWVVVATVSASISEAIVLVIVSQRLVSALRVRLSEFRLPLARPMFSFGIWTVLNQVGLLIRNAADPLILNKLATATDVTAFQIGSMPDKQSRIVFFSIFSTAQPAVTAMHATHQVDRLRRTYFRLCRYSLWISALVAAPVIICRSELFSLYLREAFDEYQAAGVVATLLLARSVVIFPNSALGMLAVGRAEVRPVAVRAGLMSAINLVLTIYLVGHLGMGAVGSALGTFLVTIVGAPILLWTLGLRLAEARFADWIKSSVVPGLVPLIPSVPVWIVADRMVRPDTWMELLLVAGLGTLAFGAGLLWPAMQDDDRRDLLAVWTRLRGKPRRA